MYQIGVGGEAFDLRVPREVPSQVQGTSGSGEATDGYLARQPDRLRSFGACEQPIPIGMQCEQRARYLRDVPMYPGGSAGGKL